MKNAVLFMLMKKTASASAFAAVPRKTQHAPFSMTTTASLVLKDKRGMNGDIEFSVDGSRLFIGSYKAIGVCNRFMKKVFWPVCPVFSG